MKKAHCFLAEKLAYGQLALYVFWYSTYWLQTLAGVVQWFETPYSCEKCFVISEICSRQDLDFAIFFLHIKWLCFIKTSNFYVLLQEDLENGEDVATCPSCSLIVKVIYDKVRNVLVLDYVFKTGDILFKVNNQQRSSRVIGS